MKLAIQYVSDTKGRPKAVQVPIREWNRLQAKLREYEQQLTLKSDLTTAFEEVELMRSGKMPKQSLADFLNEL